MAFDDLFPRKFEIRVESGQGVAFVGPYRAASVRTDTLTGPQTDEAKIVVQRIEVDPRVLQAVKPNANDPNIARVLDEIRRVLPHLRGILATVERS